MSEREAPITELVLLAQRGNLVAFGELHRRFARFVHGVALAHGSPHTADDTVQDAFAQAHVKLSLLKEPSAFGVWIAAIARQHARSTNRRGPRLVAKPARPGHASTNNASDGTQVMAALRALPDAYREPLILRLVNGMSGPEIADHTGLTPGSVRENLERGLTLLRQRLHGADGLAVDMMPFAATRGEHVGLGDAAGTDAPLHTVDEPAD